MHDKNKDTKTFTELGKHLLNGYYFCQEPYLEPNQKSGAFFAKIVNNF